jgi:eukaryotic-like serine/threonine-protein kinase
VTTAPILQLEGKVTADGWVVGPLVKRGAISSGGNFSVGYLARHPDGREGYFKALDFRKALAAPDSAAELQEMLSAYVFERDVLALCTGAKFDKVVVAVGSGAFDLPGAPLDKLYYLIFELADGDTSCQADVRFRRDSAWRLTCMHHIATAISQLHARGVYHQDLRPSNILVFDKTQTSKVADLGRSHCHGIAAPHDRNILPGVIRYAPLEQLYFYQLTDRAACRKAADLYLLGSMIYFMFTGAMITPVIMSNLRLEHRPYSDRNLAGWRGLYIDLVPYLEEAVRKSLELFKVEVARECDAKVGAELLSILQSLIDPRPEDRGHPSLRKIAYGDRYSLSRYISALDRIAKAHALALRVKHAAVAA